MALDWFRRAQAEVSAQGKKLWWYVSCRPEKGERGMGLANGPAASNTLRRAARRPATTVDPVCEARLNVGFDHFLHCGHYLFEELLAQVRDIVQSGQLKGLQGGLRASGEVIEKGSGGLHDTASCDS